MVQPGILLYYNYRNTVQYFMMPLPIRAVGNIDTQPTRKNEESVNTLPAVTYDFRGNSIPRNLRHYGSNKKITVTSLHTTNYGTIMESISITQLKMLPLDRTV